MPLAIRLKIQTYYDILLAIHFLGKSGHTATLYSVGRRAGLPHNRMRVRLKELIGLGFVDSNNDVTKRGYAFCEDYQKHVAPVLVRYGVCAPEGGPTP